MRVLEISFDSYLAPCIPEGAKLDWLAAGSSLNPRLSHDDFAKWRIGLIKAIFGIICGQYDVIIIPAIHVNNTGDFPVPIKIAKGLFKWVSRLPILPSIAAKLLRIFARVWVVFDHHDETKISEEVIGFVRPDIYFKRNLLNHYLKSDGTRFETLPMPIPRKSVRPVSWENKTRDYFLGGTYETPLRKSILMAAKELKKKGFDIDIVENRVSAEEFGERMAAAKVCFATEGVGFHTWRMYEAALCGCAVLINEPQEDISHSWKGSGNSLFHLFDLSNLSIILSDALSDESQIRAIADSGTEMALANHESVAVATKIWSQVASV